MLIIAAILAIAAAIIWIIDILNSGQGGLDLGRLWKAFFIAAALCILIDFYWDKQDSVKEIIPDKPAAAESTK